MDRLTPDPFRNGYQAYLYLGPLEDEKFSPLIPGFYTEEFVQELDRRSRVMSGKGLQSQGVARVDAESFIQMMSRDWGQPRNDWAVRRLGPLNAWEMGGAWESRGKTAKLNSWAQHKDEIRQAAQHLFDAIRQVDYTNPGPWETFPAPDIAYTVRSDAPGWQSWICRNFRTNPITAVSLGEVVMHSNRLPAVSYRATLKDGKTLVGLLPLEWSACAQEWQGAEGLDWHLTKNPFSTTEPR